LPPELTVSARPQLQPARKLPSGAKCLIDLPSFYQPPRESRRENNKSSWASRIVRFFRHPLQRIPLYAFVLPFQLAALVTSPAIPVFSQDSPISLVDLGSDTRS
jgi:hypothetical protein